MNALTHDSISLRGAGIVTISQHKKGARFTLDSLLLADFCRIRRDDAILEPGAGTGIISILLAKKFPDAAITAIELQPAIARLAEYNLSNNNVSRSVSVLVDDLKNLKKSLHGTFDAVVANPPHTKTGTGKACSLEERHASRHDHAAGIEAWLDLQIFLKNKGRYFLIFPAARSGELISLLRTRRLEPKRIRLVHPHRDRPASLFLIEAVKEAAPGVQVLPPLIIHEQDGTYSAEMQAIYALPPAS